MKFRLKMLVWRIARAFGLNPTLPSCEGQPSAYMSVIMDDSELDDYQIY